MTECNENDSTMGSQILYRAMRYRDIEWNATIANFPNNTYTYSNTSIGLIAWTENNITTQQPYLVQMPDYVDTVEAITKMPYKWGGFTHVNNFVDLVNAGRITGDISCQSPYEVGDGRVIGVDCSGFVSRAWNRRSKSSTKTLYEISSILDNINFYNLKKGDIINDTINGHVRLVREDVNIEDVRLYVIESSRTLGVHNSDYLIDNLVNSNYKPLMYNKKFNYDLNYSNFSTTESLIKQHETITASVQLENVGDEAYTGYFRAMVYNAFVDENRTDELGNPLFQIGDSVRATIAADNGTGTLNFSLDQIPEAVNSGNYIVAIEYRRSEDCWSQILRDDYEGVEEIYIDSFPNYRPYAAIVQIKKISGEKLYHASWISSYWTFYNSTNKPAEETDSLLFDITMSEPMQNVEISIFDTTINSTIPMANSHSKTWAFLIPSHLVKYGVHTLKITNNSLDLAGNKLEGFETRSDFKPGKLPVHMSDGTWSPIPQERDDIIHKITVTKDFAPAPENVKATYHLANSIKVTWDAAPKATHYMLYRGTSFYSDSCKAITGWISGTEYLDTDVTPGTTYHYWVKSAFDVSGTDQSEEYSNMASGLVISSGIVRDNFINKPECNGSEFVNQALYVPYEYLIYEHYYTENQCNSSKLIKFNKLNDHDHIVHVLLYDDNGLIGMKRLEFIDSSKVGTLEFCDERVTKYTIVVFPNFYFIGSGDYILSVSNIPQGDPFDFTPTVDYSKDIYSMECIGNVSSDYFNDVQWVVDKDTIVGTDTITRTYTTGGSHTVEYSGNFCKQNYVVKKDFHILPCFVEEVKLVQNSKPIVNYTRSYDESAAKFVFAKESFASVEKGDNVQTYIQTSLPLTGITCNVLDAALNVVYTVSPYWQSNPGTNGWNINIPTTKLKQGIYTLQLRAYKLLKLQEPTVPPIMIDTAQSGWGITMADVIGVDANYYFCVQGTSGSNIEVKTKDECSDFKAKFINYSSKTYYIDFGDGKGSLIEPASLVEHLYPSQGKYKYKVSESNKKLVEEGTVNFYSN